MATKRQRVPTSADGPQELEPEAESAGVSDAQAELSAELEAANARHLRLAADFENFKKRSRQEQAETVQFASARLAERLLAVLDNFQLALSHAPTGTDEGWLKGLELAVANLEAELKAAGVEVIEAVGQRFDPSLHEAIGSEESDLHPEDTVVAELRRGYRMHERVLRPTLVRLARPRST
ncbi:MAG TPA: nucleotide exchange factor GrpE [Candidatus Nitrosotalea sp.]|nr:nucleotide exchange factor GrpE [Candidatus Nitrosotalea sp.]